MPCVTPTGELTPSGRSILEVLLQAREVEWIADATGLPLFRTRAALREFLEADLAREVEPGRYAATEKGSTMLKGAR